MTAKKIAELTLLEQAYSFLFDLKTKEIPLETMATNIQMLINQ
jgi:hypothetical protein